MEQPLTPHQLLLLPRCASAHGKAEGAGGRTQRGITVPSVLLEVTMGSGSGEQAGLGRAGLGWAAQSDCSKCSLSPGLTQSPALDYCCFALTH